MGHIMLRPAPDDVRVARDFCARELMSVLGLDQDDDLVGDATMITSELVTNAIRAGAGTIRLHLELREDSLDGLGRRFRIAVIDDAEGEVTPRNPHPLSTNGRGLHIVGALASEWGVLPAPGGKQVWAELDLPVVEQLGDDELTDAAAS